MDQNTRSPWHPSTVQLFRRRETDLQQRQQHPPYNSHHRSLLECYQLASSFWLCNTLEIQLVSLNQAIISANYTSNLSNHRRKTTAVRALYKAHRQHFPHLAAQQLKELTHSGPRGADTIRSFQPKHVILCNIMVQQTTLHNRPSV